MPVDYESGYDFAFNRRVALADGGTAWLTICADLWYESEVGEISAFDEDGTDLPLAPEEDARLEEYIHAVRRDWLADDQ